MAGLSIGRKLFDFKAILPEKFVLNILSDK